MRKVQNQTEIKIALAQMDVIPGRPDLNSAYIIEETKKAAKRGVEIIIFPEMAVPGYFIGHLPEDDAFVRDVVLWNSKIALATFDSEIVLIFGSFGIDEKATGYDGYMRKFNAGFVAQNGRLLKNTGTGYRFTVKSLLPNYRVFKDSRG